MEVNYTPQTQRAIKHAEEATIAFNHGYVGTEHLLLGLIRTDGSVAQKALRNQGLSEHDIVEKMKVFIGMGNVAIAQPRDFTPRSKRVMGNSQINAIKYGTNKIGTEHILLALLRETSCVAVKIIESLGVDADLIYNQIVDMLSGDAKNTGKPMAGRPIKNQKSSTPTLDQFSRDFTQMARNHKFDPVIGRDKEIERVVQILSRRTKNNPCLVGEPGVGKTAIIEGLAQKIVDGTIPELLRGKRVICLDLSAMVSGTKYRGEFEERINKALDEVKNSGDVILFIDELHTIIGAGAAEGAMDASNILKPSLSRGEIQLVGATTLDEYRKHIEKDAALERRFQPVTIEEPSEEETIQILHGIKDKYEAHHKVKITDPAIEAAVTLSSRYIADRHLPDKAIDLIDEASSRVRLRSYTTPMDVKVLEEKLIKLSVEKEEAIKEEKYEFAGQIKHQENETKEQLANAKIEWEAKNTESTQVVSERDIADIVSTWTGIPVQRLEQEETERLRNMEGVLHERVIGQEAAVTAISKAIRRGRVGLKDPNKPIGSFMFLGPTGVGKTELTKTVAEALFGDENAMIRIDMSEYMEKHTVSKLIGSPPGYVGYDEGGQLTEKVRRKPYSVILFDEIEKAHPDIFNVLLQILDDGHITDSRGRRVNFKNTVIVMTSNIGARNIIEPKRLGFISIEDREQSYKVMEKNVMDEVKKLFRPEFVNRVDEIIVFHALTQGHIEEIATIMIATLIKRITSHTGIQVKLSEEAIKWLAVKGYDKAYGARPLRRTIQSEIEDHMSEEILDGNIKEGDNVYIDMHEEKLTFEVKNKHTKQ
ncbi:MAG TPA: ATP-dependent Clp protease ATP-binding subunit [Epulopiscium sp.]|nr:ATP-dependent Clp protease ATP-binding subunit [Candidatus Epulonipiscium sp.]